jgi:hypothetical protein
MHNSVDRLFCGMLVDVHFGDFLKTGVLGGVSVGMSKDELLRLWGDPFEEIVKDEIKPESVVVMCYGPIDAWIENGRVALVGIYLVLDSIDPARFRWLDVTPRREMTLDDLYGVIERARASAETKIIREREVFIRTFKITSLQEIFIRTSGNVRILYGDKLSSVIAFSTDTALGARFGRWWDSNVARAD